MGFLFEYLAWDLILISCLLFMITYYYIVTCYKFWECRGVKYVKPELLFGNIKDFMLQRKSISEVMRDLYNRCPEEPFVGIFQFWKPVLLIRDPELCKHILVKDFGYFQDRGLNLDAELDPLSVHLIFTDGFMWKFLRSKLTPTFTSGKMKKMFHVMISCADQLKDYLDSPAERGEIIDVKTIMSKFTTNIIGSCVFGIEVNCLKNPNSQFNKIAHEAFPREFWYAFKRNISMLLPKLAKTLRIKGMPDKVNNFFINLVKETIAAREKSSVNRNDFVHQLLQLKNYGVVTEEENDGDQDVDQDFATSFINKSDKYGGYKEKGGNIEFTDKLLAAQAFSFFVGGFETSAITLTYCLYYLACNKDVQDKLRAEILTSLLETDGEITYECIHKLPYLSKVFKETLRLHPPVPNAIRVVTKPYIIPGTNIQLDVGHRVVVPLCGIHYDAKYYANPYQFDPEHFSEEAIASRHNYAYMPFSAGPRNCIGMRFGTLETKLGLVTLISNFEFDTCEKTPIPIKIDPTQFIGSPLGEVGLKITKRN